MPVLVSQRLTTSRATEPAIDLPDVVQSAVDFMDGEVLAVVASDQGLTEDVDAEHNEAETVGVVLRDGSRAGFHVAASG
jgi:hypothetical protein